MILKYTRAPSVVVVAVLVCRWWNVCLCVRIIYACIRMSAPFTQYITYRHFSLVDEMLCVQWRKEKKICQSGERVVCIYISSFVWVRVWHSPPFDCIVCYCSFSFSKLLLTAPTKRAELVPFGSWYAKLQPSATVEIKNGQKQMRRWENFT